MIDSVVAELKADPTVNALTEGRVFGGETMTELDLDGLRVIPEANWYAETLPYEGTATFTLVKHPSLAVNISVMLVRVERGRCAMCGLRRVRFQLQANTGAESDAVCARCAGLR